MSELLLELEKIMHVVNSARHWYKSEREWGYPEDVCAQDKLFDAVKSLDGKKEGSWS